MSNFMGILMSACRDLSQDQEVALLLSGGIDSISVGVALEAAGKKVHAYTLELDGYTSGDMRGAQLVAHHMGWPLGIISVPSCHVSNDFIRLAVKHGCSRKVQFECSYRRLVVNTASAEKEYRTNRFLSPTQTLYSAGSLACPSISSSSPTR